MPPAADAAAQAVTDPAAEKAAAIRAAIDWFLEQLMYVLGLVRELAPGLIVGGWPAVVAFAYDVWCQFFARFLI